LGMFIRRRLFRLFCVVCAAAQLIFFFRMLIGKWVA
jgi:hypothetical protein